MMQHLLNGGSRANADPEYVPPSLAATKAPSRAVPPQRAASPGFSLPGIHPQFQGMPGLAGSQMGPNGMMGGCSTLGDTARTDLMAVSRDSCAPVCSPALCSSPNQCFLPLVCQVQCLAVRWDQMVWLVSAAPWETQVELIIWLSAETAVFQCVCLPSTLPPIILLYPLRVRCNAWQSDGTKWHDRWVMRPTQSYNSWSFGCQLQQLNVPAFACLFSLPITKYHPPSLSPIPCACVCW